jgi:hypothetical protein
MWSRLVPDPSGSPTFGHVAVDELTVSNGIITHTGSNRTTSYGKVAAAAAKLAPP